MGDLVCELLELLFLISVEVVSLVGVGVVLEAGCHVGSPP